MNEAAPQPRLRVSVLMLGGLLVVGLGAALLYGPGMIPWPELPALPDPTVSADVIQLPEEFAKPAPRPPRPTPQVVTPEPVVAAASTPTPTPIVPTPPVETAPVSDKPVARQGMLDSLNPFAGVPPTPQAPTPRQAEPPRPHTPPPTPPAQATRKGWDVLAKGKREETTQARLSEEERRRQGERPPGVSGQDLIHPARWAIPQMPLRTLYRSQEIPCVMLQAINSDMPGQTKLQSTTPVLDKFGYDTTILPKGTLIIVTQENVPKNGQVRIALKLEQLELPSGEVIDVKATVGDQSGANGMPGKVNNHYGELAAATVFSALLNIGVRSAAGTPGRGEFFQNPIQDAAQDIGHDVQRSAQSIVDSRLRIPPTITIPAGTFCTINLLENIQLNRPPQVAR